MERVEETLSYRNMTLEGFRELLGVVVHFQQRCAVEVHCTGTAEDATVVFVRRAFQDDVRAEFDAEVSKRWRRL